MKKSFRGLLAILLVISLLISLCPAVFAAPSATVIVTPATGYDSADDVVYKTENGYLVNWGARDEDCLFLTTYAQDFYTGAYTYETLSQVAGGTNASNAPSSSLYTSLQSLMTDRHTYLTKYDSSSSADCKPLYENADCYGNDTTYVSTLYRGTKVGGAWDGGKSYNQEHVWPKSKLKGTKYTDIGDIMALRAAVPNENSSRNNTAYGESAGFYDPGVSVRGDCARTLLYMYVRWGNTTTAWGADGAIESLDILLRWIEEDPVDTWEMAHNDVVQSITGTRNVFVDYPEYAFQLFGREVPSDMLTPSASGHGNTGAIGTAALVTNASSLKAGDQIIIAALGYDYAMSTTQNSSNRGQVGVTKSSGGLSYDAEAQIITLATGTASGTFGFKVGSNQYLYAASSSSNQLKTKSSLDATGSFKISIASNGAATVTASGSTTRNVLRYNATSSLFSCYGASNSQKDIAIYKLSGSGSASGCDHNYTSKITTSATCTATGVRTYTCSKCSHSYTVSVAALGHNYSSSVTKAETCTTSGVRTFTCTVCRDSYTTTIPAAGHSYSGGRCTVCGKANPNCSHSYSSRTTTSATCTATGVKTYTCSKCGDVYTESIPATGHSYSSFISTSPGCTSTGLMTNRCSKCGNSYNDVLPATGHSYAAGKCTLCGNADPNYSSDFYLFGYINGANYGCEEDSANLGSYKFVGGKLTATFATEGYVAVKRGNNADWYMTNGWMGTDATAAVLYNTEINSNPDKLYVPGGVEVTFTLIDNGDDTLFLSYETVNARVCDHSYSSVVNRQPTCVSTGVATYTCSKCGDSYIESIPVSGHSYSGGKCTLCGASDAGYSTDYYLFGYINDANYGCEDDYENLGSYRFVNGKLTATFETDGYVGVKTGDNLNWYMTEGWQGTEVTSVTLYNTGRLSNPDKLYVPGGVELTFTLQANGDDSLTLSYTRGSTGCDHRYTSQVTTQATCVSTGVATYTCSKCGHSYTESIPLGNHSYSGGKCTLCGAVDAGYSTDYYLFGFINGENYACEDDAGNLGIYKFVNGKLTATFDADGYVGVKTGDNANWYMTDGWLGMDTTSATLYNTGRLTNPDKLYVPGGVELTFTLKAGSNDSLILSYTTTSCNHNYSTQVTTNPTCTTPGVKTYTCSKCGHSYTESMALTDHSYDRGSCVFCGKADPAYSVDYYLFGFLNGSNYACEDDYENLGIYKFVNGKLTATFDTEGYVGVKTGDNASWYMTDGWQGLETTSVTLYNTGRLTNPDKLYVPGGVELTFTLNVNGDDSLTLSYTAASSDCSHSYRSEVTTNPTCIATGVKTYTCDRCGHSYTETLATTGHSYSGGSCTVCGTAAPGSNVDYYLFGYINGSNYACEDDAENLGVYKFENGKLTATFDAEGYVGVKTGDNASWYMTDGWQGLETTSATLYNTGRLTNPDKLYVPGGVELTFTLEVNSDDSLTLSYTVSDSACSHSYSSRVLTVATCTANGVTLYTCSKCGDSYTQNIAATGHSYANGKCTACGLAAPEATVDYYLFGYINGSNYACEEDDQNTGDYKFVGGKLTVTFESDSYVGVKTGDNATWYMTDGWQGLEKTTVTLFDTGRLTNPDKLYVPGGVQLTFTLKENSDGSLTLSYGSTVCSHDYTCQVTTPATCTTAGVNTYTCLSCGHSYTEAVAPTDHSFVGGSCTGCGMAAPESNAGYYLFGYINGSNYACEEDSENAGDYKFVGGKLTTTFDTDSYVGIKTGDNASWYMTEGWQGLEKTSVTLYDTGRLTNPDKLYVPGGVSLTFTLKVNGDGSLTLSYTTGNASCSHSYSAKVTTNPTCTAEGVKTFTCDLCGHSYTQSVAATGHSYSGGSCTLCGAAEPARSVDYYLFGWINGSNYGCENDAENLGIYKFVNGKLTATFDTESYVGIKTGDNASWYMTDGWQGLETTSVTLHNTGRLTNPDKLYVPGGVSLTFTLKENADGTLTLSYAAGSGCVHDYTSRVITAATCTANGQQIHTCRLCGDSYTSSIAALGHSFQGNKCSVCGLVDSANPADTYYLFGFINGADCGYDSDLENLGYKFVDGKVVVTFTEESYVAVKTGDNTAWYYTADWMGEETNTATLYNSTTLSAEYKLYVPGGMQMIFSLKDNGNDTLTLSYTVSGCVYNAQITKAATCSADGVKTYTCSDCGHSYTEVISATGHSYENGSCTSCGKADPAFGVDYYLFGYINGSDYGCEGDWQNVGSYKFEGGRLTATFDTDSYVAVKTGDNSKWYMTEGWQSFDANCVTLYDADELTNADKLFIPGGVPMVFTLIVNNDGTLTLACVPDRCIHTYTSQVTVEPTCTADGEITYSCDNCSCSYTEILAATGHQYAGNRCTLCGSQLDSRDMGSYYLFGYIDGRDYACESDWQNLGNFRFSDSNTCSVTFASDSYVGVKEVNPSTGEVVGWYMTNGWLGFDARNATLCNTQYLGGNADKLYVPGGVRLTFTLVENADGTLSLSYGSVNCDHTYGGGKITTQATCLGHGVRAYTCTLCGHFYEEVIPATGHSCFNGVCIGCGAADPNESCCANHNYLLSTEIMPSCTQSGTHTSRAACGATYTEDLPATGHSYNTRVTTAATCVLPGLKTYTCVCGDSYSEPIEALGHQYRNGVCQSCGASESTGEVVDNTYYLFGYINGADYGCNDDWENLGEYLFVGGQLTATFDTDSYVAIKTGDNVNWFMTESFVTTDSATFYNTNTGVYEKMLVPGGVRVTFTLTENGDGSLSLSYTTSGAGESVILPNLSLQYPTLSFKDEVKLNIYYDATDLDNVVDMGLVVFNSQVSSYTVYNADSVVSGYKFNTSAGLYTVSTNGIPAKNMGDTIWFAVYAQLSNGTYAYSKLVSYSPRDYAYALLGSGDAKLDALLVAMLNYGAAAQLYFGYNTGNLLNSGLTAAQKGLVSAYDSSMVAEVAKPSSNKQAGFISNGGFDDKYPSVTFGGAFAINYYCVPSYIPAGGVSMYYWTDAQYHSVGALTRDNASGVVQMTNNGVYRASVTGISAKDICDGVFVAFVYNNGGKTYRSGILPYSIGKYCEALADYDNDFTPFAKATAVYGYYAKQYFG